MKLDAKDLEISALKFDAYEWKIECQKARDAAGHEADCVFCGSAGGLHSTRCVVVNPTGSKPVDDSRDAEIAKLRRVVAHARILPTPCRVRMPAEEGEFLCWHANYGWAVVDYVGDGQWKWRMKLVPVSHWQRLPETP